MSDLENTSNNEAVNPNDALCTIEMINYQGAREEIDIWGQLDIYESMYDQTVHGSVMIFDGAGFEERFPIVGQEFIYITYKSQSKSGLKVERVYHIIKMSETMIDERRMVYNLYFCSVEFLLNLKYRVSKSYKGWFSHEIVQDIYEKYILNNLTDVEGLSYDQKPLLYEQKGKVDSDAYTYQYVMANFRPFEAINMVTKKARPSNVKSIGGYVFYENKNGYNFRSIESLLYPEDTDQDVDYQFNEKFLEIDDRSTVRRDKTGAPVAKIKGNAKSTANDLFPSEVYVLVPANAGPFDIKDEERIIRNYRFTSRFDVVSNLVGGMYGSRLLVYDPVTQRIGSITETDNGKSSETKMKISNAEQRHYNFDYHSYFDSYKHVQEGVNIASNPLMTSNHIGLGSSQATHSFYTTNAERNLRKTTRVLQDKMTKGREKSYDNRVERWMLPNMSQNRQLKNIVLTVTVGGDHNRTVGDIIKIRMPSMYFNNEEHYYLRGNYMVPRVHHKITSSRTYVTELEMVKDSLFNPLIEPVKLEGENTGTQMSAVPGGGGSVTSPEYNTTNKVGSQTSITY